MSILQYIFMIIIVTFYIIYMPISKFNTIYIFIKLFREEWAKIFIWKVAAYLRLSKEDNKNMISNSIRNQKVLINEYIAKRQDLSLIDYYIDDGYGVTNFNRPAFKRLL